jgi:hypothetical protein
MKIHHLYLSLAVAVLAVPAATAAVANDVRPVNDPISAQLTARGLDPVAVRAELVNLSRAERVVRLNELGVQLPTRVLPEGAALQGFKAVPMPTDTQLTRPADGEMTILPYPYPILPIAPGEPNPSRPVVIDRGTGLPVIEGSVVSSDGQVIARPLPSDVAGVPGATRPGNAGSK